MLWSLIGLLVLLWVLGLVFKIGGALIHVVLVIAAVVLLFRLVTGRS